MADETQGSEPIQIGGIELRAGARIGAYIYVREIGSGGMARVILAKNPSGQRVALKVLRKSRIQHGLKRFHREFRALSRIRHPNVVRVEAYGDLFGHPFIAMEYVDGPDLHQLIRSFRSMDPLIRWQRTEEILIDLCRALSAVHAKGLVHRDLKPSNVLIDQDGACRLTDFGIVKDLDPGHDPQGGSTTLVGTWAYASPEQCKGEAIDARSDLYSLGIILYAMLTGKRPFIAKDLQGYLEIHRQQEVPSPRRIRPLVPVHLDEICQRLLQKEKGDRYQSAKEILYRLEAEERPPTISTTEQWAPPLVGRSDALHGLRDALGRLTSGEGGLVLLEGPGGIGRTRLLEAALAAAEPMGFGLQRIDFRKRLPTLEATARMLTRVLSSCEKESVSQSLREEVLQLQGSEGEARRQPMRTLDTARSVYRHALEGGAQVLAVDDLHLAQTSEVELFLGLLKSMVLTERRPLLVIASLRERGSDDAIQLIDALDEGLRIDRIGIDPLTAEDLLELVSNLLGPTQSAKQLAERLAIETEGNPLYVVAYLRYLMNRNAIQLTARGYELTLTLEQIKTGHLEVPPGIRQLIRTQARAVQKPQQLILEVLSVARRALDIEILLDLLDMDETDALDAMAPLLQRGLIREHRTDADLFHAISHPTISDVIYRDLKTSRRVRLHRDMAVAFELRYAHAPMALEIVGEHYRKAGEIGRAFRYLVQAAKRKADRCMVQEAWALCERAGGLEETAATELEETAYRVLRRELLSVRASVFDSRGAWDDAAKGWLAVLGLAEEDRQPAKACEARLQLAKVLRRKGDHDASARHSEQALESARLLNDNHKIGEALHNMAALAWSRGRSEDCERLAQEGLLIATGPSMASLRAELLMARTTAQAIKGQIIPAIAGLTEAEGIFRELRLQRPRCLTLANLSELLLWLGEPHEALQRAKLAVELSKESDYRLGLTASLRALAAAYLELGQYPPADRCLRTAVALAQETGIHEEQVACLTLIAQAALERGDHRTAAKAAEQGMERTSQRDPESYGPMLQALLANALHAHEPAAAQQHWQQAHEAVQTLTLPRRTQVSLQLAHSAAALDDTASCKRLGRWVLQTAGHRGLRLYGTQARALMALHSAGEDQRTHVRVLRDLLSDVLAPLSEEDRALFLSRPIYRSAEYAPQPD